MNPIVDAQLDHNHWATAEIIRACEGLDAREYRREFDLGFRTLERTLAHIIEVMDYIADGLAARPYQERADLEHGRFSPPELLAHLDRAGTGLKEAARLSSESLEFPVGSSRTTTRTVILQQAFDHGSHHRAQCLCMLKQLGVRLEVHPLRWAGVDPGDEPPGDGD